MKNKGLIIGIFVLLVAVGGYFAWQQQIKKPKEDGKEAVTIGVIMPQTGFLASPGKDVIKGITLYFDEFNKKHKDKSVNLIIEDSKSDPKIGVNAINKLISIDKIKVIIGDLGSPIFLAMAPIAEKNKIVMISPGASNPKVRDAGDYIFRDYPSDEFDGKIMAKYMKNKLNIKTTAVAYFNNDYGVGLEDAFVKEFEREGGNINLVESFDDDNLNFRNIVTKLKKENHNSIYFVGSPKQCAYFLKQLKEQNVIIDVFGNLAFEDREFIDIAKNSFDNVIYTAPYFDIKRKDTKMINFLKEYADKYNQNPDLTSALGYDVANILGISLEKANFNTNKLKDELYKIKNFNGLTGNTSFDSKGDVVKEISINRINGDGRIENVQVIKP